MKKKISIWILLLLVVCLFALVGCDKEGGSDMENAITIRGRIDGKVAVNPAFDWEDPQSDPAFSLVLRDALGEVIFEEDTELPHFESKKCLDYGTKYTLTITGSESGEVRTISFETVSGEGTPKISASSVSVCEPYKSHMVLQRGKEIVIKGQAPEKTLVILEFLGATYYTTATESGEYNFTLPAMQANATPNDLEIRLLPNRKITIGDVLIGDVYLVSGQSNIQREMKTADYQASDVEDAIACGVRYYAQSEQTAASPVDTTRDGRWFKVNRGDNGYRDYSAVAFMVGSMLGKELAKEGVPLGIVYAAKGNTNITSWIGKDYNADAPERTHYNGMIYPLRHVKFTGVVWYQGCNNSGKGCDYKALLETLFANWRALFGNGELPFYVVQLPVYDGSIEQGNNYDFSYVRESQYKACAADENAYLIATCDDGDPNDIHPRHKRYICERLTKSILATHYGADYEKQSPTYRSHTFEGNCAIVTVNDGAGLYVPEGEEIVGFLLAGEDGKYYDASAVITDGKIVVTSEKVAAPRYIKYGFSKSPFLNIYNKDGFLMSPFRTDDYNRNIDLLDYTDGATYASHPDGSVMECEVVTAEGATGLKITKPNDGKDFGSLQLEKWGAIGYHETGMNLTVLGTGSGADVLFRIVEGSGEIWAYEFKDDRAGKRELSLLLSDFRCVYNPSDGVLDCQTVMNIEVTVKTQASATITILEARFVDVPRQKPTEFSIDVARNDGRTCTVKYSQAIFADEYRVIVSADGENFRDPVYDETTDRTKITFDASLCSADKDYYVKVIAMNDEFGETVAKNSGLAFGTVDRLVLGEFRFADDESLELYRTSKMIVHPHLEISRSEKGIKINVSEKGDWMHCIVVVEDGANKEYDALKFYIDLSECQGNVIIQLQDKDGSNSYTYSGLPAGAKGYFEIPFRSFSGYDASKSVGRIAFNFIDYVGGSEDNAYLADLEYLKSK